MSSAVRKLSHLLPTIWNLRIAPEKSSSRNVAFYGFLYSDDPADRIAALTSSVFHEQVEENSADGHAKPDFRESYYRIPVRPRSLGGAQPCR